MDSGDQAAYSKKELDAAFVAPVTAKKPHKKQLLLGVILIVLSILVGALALVQNQKITEAKNNTDIAVEECTQTYANAQFTQEQLQRLITVSKPWIPSDNLIPVVDTSELPMCPSIPKRTELSHFQTITAAADKNRSALESRIDEDAQVGKEVGALAYENAKTGLVNAGRDVANQIKDLGDLVKKIQDAATNVDGGALEEKNKKSFDEIASKQEQLRKDLNETTTRTTKSLDGWDDVKILTGSEYIAQTIAICEDWNDYSGKYKSQAEAIQKQLEQLKNIEKTQNEAIKQAEAARKAAEQAATLPPAQGAQNSGTGTTSRPRPTAPSSGSNGAQAPDPGDNSTQTGPPVFCYQENEEGQGQLVPCN